MKILCNTQTVKDNKRVTLSGFGTFSSNKTNARTGRNPSTGQDVYIPEKRRIKFKASGVFKDIINK